MTESETKISLEDSEVYSPYKAVTVKSTDRSFETKGQLFQSTNARIPQTKETDTKGAPMEEDKYWRDVWHSTGKELGVSGLRYATSRTEPLARRILWCVLIISGLIFMTYQLFESFDEYFSRTSATSVDEIFPDELRFPTLTICNENRIVRSRARAYGVEAAIENLNPPWVGMGYYPNPNITAARLELLQAYQNSNFSSQEEFVRNMSHTYDRTFYGCFFSSKECNSSMFEEVWTDMGLCYQFNPGSMDVMVERAGGNYGLTLWLNADQNEYLATKDYAAGFRLKADTSGAFVSMAHDGVRVTPGYITTIQLHQTDTVLLGPPYGNCSSARHLRRFSHYSSFHCQTECLVDYIVARCGCTPLQYPSLAGEPTCTLDVTATCVGRAYYTYIAESRGVSCECEPECAYTTYSMVYSSNVLSHHYVNYISQNVTGGRVTQTMIRDSFVAVNIYYPRLSFKKVQSQVAYTTTMLFNDLGGALGLMLGSTFFTIYEVLDIFMWAGIYRCKEKKKVGNGNS